MHCPSCEGTELQIVATSVRWVSIDGDGDVTDDPGGDIEWSDDSDARCDECDWEGKVKDLNDDES